MLRANAWVVQARCDGVHWRRLPLCGLKQLGVHAMQHSWRSKSHSCSVTCTFQALTCRFDALDLDGVVVKERREQTKGVGPTTHASHQVVRQTAFLLKDLRFGLAANNRLEIANDGWVWIWPNNRTNCKEVLVWSGSINAKCGVNGFLKGTATKLNRNNLRAKHLHASDVRVLFSHVNGAHVNLTIQSHKRGRLSKRNTVLTCTSLSNESLLAHALCQQSLTKAVVDLVSTGVVEVLTLEVHLGAAQFTRQVLCKVEQ